MGKTWSRQNVLWWTGSDIDPVRFLMELTSTRPWRSWGGILKHRESAATLIWGTAYSMIPIDKLFFKKLLHIPVTVWNSDCVQIPLLTNMPALISSCYRSNILPVTVVQNTLTWVVSQTQYYLSSRTVLFSTYTCLGNRRRLRKVSSLIDLNSGDFTTFFQCLSLGGLSDEPFFPRFRRSKNSRDLCLQRNIMRLAETLEGRYLRLRRPLSPSPKCLLFKYLNIRCALKKKTVHASEMNATFTSASFRTEAGLAAGLSNSLLARMVL